MISHPADVINTRPATSALARFADRWVYVFMAGLFIITALAGFIPDSVAILTEVRAQARPPLSPVMHMHALLMGPGCCYCSHRHCWWQRADELCIESSELSLYFSCL
jgi:hypothetical protein